MTDDDDTPRDRPSTNGDRHHPVSTYHEGNPWGAIDELRSRMTGMERTVASDQIELSSLLGSRKTWRWAVGLGAPTMIGALVTVMLYLAGQVSMSSERVGATSARIEALGETLRTLQQEVIRNLQQDIRDLRSEFSRMGGLPSGTSARARASVLPGGLR